MKRPYENYKKGLTEYMVNELNDGKKPFELLFDLCYGMKLVDVDLFSQAVKIHYKQRGKKSPTSVIKGQMKKLENRNNEMYIKLQGNCDKMERFFDEINI